MATTPTIASNELPDDYRDETLLCATCEADTVHDCECFGAVETAYGFDLRLRRTCETCATVTVLWGSDHPDHDECFDGWYTRSPQRSYWELV